MARLDIAGLNRLQEENRKKMAGRAQRTLVTVHGGTCGNASGAKKVWEALSQAVTEAADPGIELQASGCAGLCNHEPMVTIEQNGRPPVRYVHLNPDKSRRVFDEHVRQGKVVEDLALPEIPFYTRQLLIANRHRGILDPRSIDEYIGLGGYQATARALSSMTPEQIVKTVTDSGLRGRGGAGYMTGWKWESCADHHHAVKYMLCNADEGDPGAFMDRAILEGDPHSVIEGMIIGAKAIAAHYGYIYVRAEYPLAVEHLRIAIRQAEDYGLLGRDILGTGFDFDLKLSLGSGAFVCGEATALMRSIEGKRGTPRPKPPHTAHKGLWMKPTVLNNVETFANIPPIIMKGAEWYAGIGYQKSKGTKVFALSGPVNNIGLVEVPMGMTLRDIVFDIGGGIKGGKKFKAVQIGGPSGGCLPEKLLDTPVDYEAIMATGAIMGSGGLVVMDETSCMVDVAKFFLAFTVDESCGKCTPCRVGTRVLYDLLVKITEGKGVSEDLKLLEDLSKDIIDSSLCGLGQSAPNPVLTTLKYFRDEYEAHVNEKRCPAGACKALIQFYINDKCTGCTVCAKVCPVHCITGERKQRHVIDKAACTRCSSCLRACKFKAIDIIPNSVTPAAGACP